MRRALMSGKEDIDFCSTEEVPIKVSPVLGQNKDSVHPKTVHMALLRNFYALYHTDTHKFELKSTKVLPFDRSETVLAKLSESDKDFAATQDFLARYKPDTINW